MFVPRRPLCCAVVTVGADGGVLLRGSLADCAPPVRLPGAGGVVPSVDVVVCTGFLAGGLASAVARGGVALVDNRGTPADLGDDAVLQFVVNGQGATNDTELLLLGTPGCPLPADQAPHVASPPGTSLQLNGPLRFDPATLAVDLYASEWQGYLPATLGAMNDGGSVFSDFAQTYTAAALGAPPAPAPSAATAGASPLPSPSLAPGAGTCGNNAADAGESGIDCGGDTDCPRCGMGRRCDSTTDCAAVTEDALMCARAVCLPLAVAQAPLLVSGEFGGVHPRVVPQCRALLCGVPHPPPCPPPLLLLPAVNVTLSGADPAELTRAAEEVIRQILAAAAGSLPIGNTTVADILFTAAAASARGRRLLGAAGSQPHGRLRALAAAGDALALDLAVAAYTPAAASAISVAIGCGTAGRAGARHRRPRQSAPHVW